ncbi:MAG TPA: TonB-dependent siderophore receptor [Steroidobacteraceae bacterium]|nr:TonB-dependent siderophore receptor [Steroidobacteraceae bacterium]
MTRSTACAAILALVSLTWGGVARAGDSDAEGAQQPSQQPSLPRVTVIGRQTPEENYRLEAVDSLGPLGSTKILDAPYSISILPLDLIENSMAVNFKDVSKYLPLVAYQEQQGPDILRPQTRGMQGGNFQNSRLDGMQMFVTVANALEQFQQIEVLNGVSASLYGPANPSGMFNFVSKRPTGYDLKRVSITYNSDSIGTAHIDLGGRIDQGGVLSYRLNALFGEGGGYVDGSHQRRVLGDLGVDIRPWQDTVLELNYSDYHLVDLGYPGWFTYGEKIVLPAAPDPTRVGYGQTYAGVDLETRIASARLKHDFSSNWHLVVGALNQDALRNINTPVNNLTSNLGNYTSSFANGFAPRFIMTSDAGYLNGDFLALGVAHDLTIGTAGYKSQSYSVITPATAASVLLGKANINSPRSFPEPPAGPPYTGLNFDSSTTYQQGINAGDTIRFNEEWSTRLAVSQDWFHVDNYNAKAKALPEYSNRGVSPTASLMYKPVDKVTTYVTYASSLQAGDLAPGIPGAPGTVVNAGESLPPYRSKEIEAGIKASLAKIDFTAAIFRIQRPFANIDLSENVFKISGNQVNKGLELSAVGELVSGLTVYGGITLLNARLEETALATTNDRTFVGAPKVKGNTLFEYRIPGMERLVAVFDWQFTGPRPGNDTNSFYAAGYNLFDIGARYSSGLLGKNITWRLSVNNVTDKNYWSTVAPSNLTGANAGNLVAHLGAPRTVLASASVDF